MNMEYPEIKPLNGKTDKLMVMLHGVGSDGNDLISLVPYIQKSLPNYHFISLHGVESYDMAPFGRQWFSLQDRTPDTIMKLVAVSAPLTFKLIQDKQKELGLTNAETILFGFSQGTMMATYLTLIQEIPFAALVGFSGRLLPPKLKNKLTPFCLIHGEDDDVVEANGSIDTAEYCKQNNIEHQLLIVPNLTHSIDASGIEFAVEFLKNIS